MFLQLRKNQEEEEQEEEEDDDDEEEEEESEGEDDEEVTINIPRTPNGSRAQVRHVSLGSSVHVHNLLLQQLGQAMYADPCTTTKCYYRAVVFYETK